MREQMTLTDLNKELMIFEGITWNEENKVVSKTLTFNPAFNRYQVVLDGHHYFSCQDKNESIRVFNDIKWEELD